MLKLLNLPARTAAGLLVLASTSVTVRAMPVLTAAAPSPVQQVRYHHRHRHHAVYPVHRYGAAPGYGYEGGPAYADPGGASAFGGFANRTNGAPPDNEFDPERPYGGQSAITAPPGTDAYEEQANQRRYFCEFSPSRC